MRSRRAGWSGMVPGAMLTGNCRTDWHRPTNPVTTLSTCPLAWNPIMRPIAANDTAPSSASRQVTGLTRARPATDGAGVRMNRLQGAPDLRGFDPFLMLDEFKSDDPSAYIGGFPDHP